MKIDLLVIVAHPDDAELCCAGTLLKHKQLGYSIGIVDLTRGELGSRGSADIRDKEAAARAQVLGLDARENLDLGDGQFENNHASRLRIIEQIRKYQPEIVLTNAISDRHPDHGRAAKLVSDACYFSGLLKIETAMNGEQQSHWRPKQVWHMLQDYYHHPDIVIDVTEHWAKKMEAIACFSSQFFQEKDEGPKTPISSKEFWDFLEARARTVGRPSGFTLGEGFTKSRTIGVNNLFDLK